MNIKEQIEKFKYLQVKMLEAEKYYKGENVAIMERRKTFYNIASRRETDDYTKANYKLPSGYTKIIVDQKRNFSINSKMTIDSEGLEDIININKFKQDLTKLARTASNKFYAVIQWYIKNGELKYKKIPPEQIIIVKDYDDNDLIKYVIRTYKENDKTFATVYSDDSVETWLEDNGEYKLVNVASNQIKMSIDGVENEDMSQSWGMPPFSVMYNNDMMMNDLESFKRFIDAYDFVNSDFANNLEDFNEAYWILKNYGGQDAEEFISEFKKSRIAKVAGDGDMSQETREIPHAARIAMLTALKADIYRFGMGVDADTIKGDATNLMIEALFSNLNLKANDFEAQVQEFADSCLYFINRYNYVMNKPIIEDLKLTFQRTMIKNNADLAKLANESKGSLSEYTRLSNDPRVENVDEEIEMMNAENTITLT